MSSSGVGGAKEEQFRCFVKGLAWGMNDHGLASIFRRFGRVLDAKIIMHKDSGMSRGFGFVTFDTQQALDDAIEGFNQKELDGRTITVKLATPPGTKEREREYEQWGEREKERSYEQAVQDRGFQRDEQRDPQRDYVSGYSGRDTSCFNCGRSGHWARECRDRYVRPEREQLGYRRFVDRPPPPHPADLYDHYDRYDDGYEREERSVRYDYPRNERLRRSGPLRHDNYRERAGPYDRSSVAMSYDRPRLRGPRSAYDRY